MKVMIALLLTCVLSSAQAALMPPIFKSGFDDDSEEIVFEISTHQFQVLEGIMSTDGVCLKGLIFLELKSFSEILNGEEIDTQVYSCLVIEIY